MEKNNLKEIIKLSDSIRDKYISLKRGLADTEYALQETFKPIVTPLNTLVKQSQIVEPKQKNIKLEPKQEVETERKKPVEKWVNFLKTGTVAKSEAETSIEDEIEKALLSEAGLSEIQKYLESYGPISRRYMTMYITNDKNIDKSTYGLRYDGGHWKLGNANIGIEYDDLFIGNEIYEGTEGLYELIFLKNPNNDVITTQDSENYYKIINTTSANRRDYSTSGQIKGSKSFKYKKIYSR